MSELVTFTEVSVPDPRDDAVLLSSPGPRQSFLDGNSAPQGKPAVHCGTAMQLVTPAVGPEGASYTFPQAGTGGIELPPVWRCRCGFQLDAWNAGGSRGHRDVASAAGSLTAAVPA